MIRIIVAAGAGEDVGAFGADVADFERGRGVDLALDGEIPGVDGWEADRAGNGESGDTIGEDVIAVGTFGLRGKNGRRIERGGAVGEREDGLEVIGGIVGLNAENRQVLRDNDSRANQVVHVGLLGGQGVS